jgi:hypothetical protein
LAILSLAVIGKDGDARTIPSFRQRVFGQYGQKWTHEYTNMAEIILINNLKAESSSVETVLDKVVIPKTRRRDLGATQNGPGLG